MTLKQLTEELHQAKQKAYPNMPAHAIVKDKLTDKTANGLTQCIIKFFELKGIKAWRQQSGGRYLREKSEKNIMGGRVITQKGKFIPQGKAGGKGAGDVSCVVRGRFVSIEVKIGNDRQSDVQKEFQREIEGSGGVYFITKTWDDFYFQIEKVLNSGQQTLQL